MEQVFHQISKVLSFRLEQLSMSKSESGEMHRRNQCLSHHLSSLELKTQAASNYVLNSSESSEIFSPSVSESTIDSNHLKIPSLVLNGESSDGSRRGSICIERRDSLSSLSSDQNGSYSSLSLESSEIPADPWCDPNNPVVIKFQDISAAAYKIRNGIMRTPCTRSHMSTMTGMEIYFKKEFLQYTGSFKERGARYTLLMLNDEQKKNGVIAASAGNHALALCYHGTDLNIPVTVIMPLIAPIMKVQLCCMYGAEVIVKGNDIGDSRKYALKLARERNLTYINGYDHPHILAGQGTMGLEIMEQVQNVDAIIIPVGGGGLIAGTALAAKSLNPNVQIIGVEPERCASFSEAMKAGRPVQTKTSPTLADGLAVPLVGVNAFATASGLIDMMVTVSEEMIAIAILRLVELEKAVVEGAGAAALAAILAGKLPGLRGKRVVIPLCGGNIDTTVLGRCLERGLAADGRLVKFTVSMSDRPGSMAEITKLISELGISIKDIAQERAWLKEDIFSVQTTITCETRDREHSEELQRVLLKRYNNLRYMSMLE